MEAAYSIAAKIAAHTAVRDFIDSGGADASPGYMNIFDGNDICLTCIELAFPCGEINPTTAILTLYPVISTYEAYENGVASYAQLCAGSNSAECLRVPVSSGDAPLTGSFVLSTTSIVQGDVVSLVSATLG